MLKRDPLKGLEIEEVICDGDTSVNSRLRKDFPGITIQNCIGHKATKVKKEVDRFI